MTNTRAPRPASYKFMQTCLHEALDDMRILAGEKVWPVGVTWKDVAGTAAVNFSCLVQQLEQARQVDFASGPTVTFPSPDKKSEGKS